MKVLRAGAATFNEALEFPSDNLVHFEIGTDESEDNFEVGPDESGLSFESDTEGSVGHFDQKTLSTPPTTAHVSTESSVFYLALPDW